MVCSEVAEMTAMCSEVESKLGYDVLFVALVLFTFCVVAAMCKLYSDVCAVYQVHNCRIMFV